MKVIQGGWKIAFLCFFTSHIPITIFIDGQGWSWLLKPYYPQPLQSLVEWYGDVFGDVLMKSLPSPIWFQSLIATEVVFQLPFFIVAIKVLLQSPIPPSTSLSEQVSDYHYPAWFKTLCLIYGSHVMTTLIPILTTFWTSDMTKIQIILTTLVYSPYFIFPMMLTYLAAVDDFHVTSFYNSIPGKYRHDQEYDNKGA